MKHRSRIQRRRVDRKIAENRLVRHQYHLGDTWEAGLVLEGWEIKSLREGQVSLRDSYVRFHRGEAWLTGANISPLKQRCSHTLASPQRDRKLLLSRRCLDFLAQRVKQAGYTVVTTDLHWKGPWAKAQLALARGKQSHDVRHDQRTKDWQREKAQLLKGQSRSLP